jgi:hypothetical protein
MVTGLGWQEFLKKCDDRKALFDNKTKNKAKQTKQTNDLLRVIDDMLVKNGGSPYANELFKEAQVFFLPYSSCLYFRILIWYFYFLCTSSLYWGIM